MVVAARGMHMRRIPIRMKLAAALAVPLIGLFFITVVEVAETAADVDDVRAQTALARASVGPSGVITALQNERTWVVVELIGQENAVQPPVVGYDESRRLTDEAITAFRDTLEGGSEAASDAYAQALRGLDTLDDLRATIDANTAPRDLGNVGAANDVYQEYFALIRPFLDANSRVALAIDDAELRQATSLVDTTTRQLETLSELARTSILEITLGGGLDKPSEIASIARLRSTFDAGNKRLVEAPPPFDAVVGATYPSGLVEGFTGALDQALAGQPPDLASMLATLNVPRDEGYMGIRNALVDALNERADDLNAAAERRERIYVAMAILTLLIAIGLTWAVSRSITRPLRALTRQAKDMADRRLPDAVTDILETPLGENITVPTVDAVRIRTRDEVSDVADALNTVQDTALDLAVEQAVLRRNIADSFVNLGRRNQNLLGRQLDFITELESNETNADTLSNLFRLDHLATRMRRNAESLLVLAGIEPPRQWAAPVRLTDVIRAALGEVEDYQRVTVRGVEPATIVGSAAADLAHLLAELIENALVFSPPDQTVDIRGRNRPGHGGDGIAPGYTLAIIDSGLGMPAGDIAAANRRLAGAESFTVAPSKYLGHYVAGNLAARHDIRVTLDNSPGNGVTATVDLPPALLTSESELAAVPAPPGREAIGEAGAFGVPALPLGAPHAAGPRPVEVPPAPAFDAAQLDALAAFGPPAAAPPPPAAVEASPPTRTASGLVKRSRRGPETAPTAAVPDGELLANLSSITSNLPKRAPQVPAAPAAREATPPTNPWTPTARQDRHGTSRSWPAPPDLGRPAPSPADPGRPALPSRGGNGASGVRGPAGPPPGEAAGGATSSGLARRVRGAQLPATQPLNLRRRQDHPSDPPAGYRQHDHDDSRGHTLGNGNTNGQTNGLANGRDRGRGPVGPPGSGDRASSAADSVYGFLTSFTQGVQRGLDEARRDPNGPKENP
jgi:signal transduction histidine kinase